MKRAFASVGIRRSDIPIATRVRFLQKIAWSPDCWEWQGSKSAQGYGRFNLGQDRGGTTAQRAAYAILVGDLKPGLTIDHKCRNRGCVNPAHLEAVPHRVNIMRGEGVTAKHARKTHCGKGHELVRKVWPGSSQRLCPICRRDYLREYMREWRKRR